MQVLCEFCNIEKGTEIVDYRMCVSPERHKVTVEKVKLAMIMASRRQERSRPAKRFEYLAENAIIDVLLQGFW